MFYGLYDRFTPYKRPYKVYLRCRKCDSSKAIASNIVTRNINFFRYKSGVISIDNLVRHIQEQGTKDCPKCDNPYTIIRVEYGDNL